MTEQTRMYGRVLYELHLPEKMVCEMVKVIRENPLLVQILSDPVLPSFKKDRIIEKVWRASEFTEIVPSFLKKVCAAGCIGSMDSILSVWEQCLGDEKGIIQAELFYVTPPDEEELQKIRRFLCGKYGKKEVQFILASAPELIGGFLLRTENVEYDYSLKSRLEELFGI